MLCGPKWLHRITLVSFRLFRNNLGSLRHFFWANSPQLPVRLWVKRERKRPFSVNSEEQREVLIKIHENL